MITVALPTWGNKDIVFLAMEGLIRQKDSPPWELLVLECRSANEAGTTFFESYWDKLQKAGCIRLQYEYSKKHMPLNQKWLTMAHQASCESEAFLLQGADDYPHPERNKTAGEAIAAGHDWYDCRYYYQYHIALDKMIMYDNGQEDAGSPGIWKTGFNMAMKTQRVRDIVSNKYVRKGVDFWLFDNTNTKSRYVDQTKYKGVSTTGLNTISNKRFKFFHDTIPPFYDTDETLDSMGLPKKIVKQIRELSKIAVVNKTDLRNNDPVFVEFKKKINGMVPGHRKHIPRYAVNYFMIRDAIEIIFHDEPNQKNLELCL